MRNDYKSRNDLFERGGRHRPPRMGLMAVAGLALCATAIYAALGSAGNDAPQQANQATTQPSIPEPSSVPLKVVPPEAQQIALVLPTKPQAHKVAAKQTPRIEPAGTGPQSMQLSLRSEREITTDETPPSIVDTQIDQQAALEMETAEESDVDELAVTPNRGHWLEEKVTQGDSLARIFSRLDLSANLLHRIVNSSQKAKSLANIRPGETIRVRLAEDGELLELLHQQSKIRSLQILPANEGFSAKVLDRSLETRIANASGTITSSLYLGAQRAGLSDTLIMELANIFGWDIDFALEIRASDQFSLIYEEQYLDGEKFSDGAILAAEFINQGKVFRAIRFEDDEGYASYYSPEGESMRKAFLRAPVDFRRISSRFTKARYHPVLGKKRPHRGVDYAAATGTPIKASGDGRVTFRGRKGGYGRTIMIRHGSQYTTLYAHMSKFRGSVKQGSRVRQGQVIGYVGKSGLATGPHLHYEFRVNGVHRNPLTIKLPAAEPLKKQHRARFSALSAPLLSQLDLISKTMVADAR